MRVIVDHYKILFVCLVVFSQHLALFPTYICKSYCLLYEYSRGIHDDYNIFPTTSDLIGEHYSWTWEGRIVEFLLFARVLTSNLVLVRVLPYFHVRILLCPGKKF